MEELFKALAVSASGLRAQSQRMRIIAENMANAKSLPQSPDQEPYRRKVLTFSNRLDRALGVEVVTVNKVQFDQSAFKRRYDPISGEPDYNAVVRLDPTGSSPAR